MKRSLAASLVLLAVACGSSSGVGVDGSDVTSAAPPPAILASFETPTAAGLQPVVDAIGGAQTSIQMVIYHLTVASVVDALAVAGKRGVKVEIIVDQANWNEHTPTALQTELASAGVVVTPSSTGFRITHEKSFVVDGTTAWIMSLNLTSPFTYSRDYAVETQDPGVVKDFQALFQADLANAKTGGSATPALTSPSVVVSPVNSEARLSALVASATSTIIASSENLGDKDIQAALVAAAGRGVKVRVLAPECDENPDATFDLPFLAELATGGATVHAMPAPSSASLPYQHAKMIVVDGAHAYIGSVNFSTSSTTDARELGIVFDDAKTIAMISAAFESDWALAITPPPASTVTCPAD